MAQLLSAVTPGTLVKLNENGSPVEFYVAKHDYESGLNGPGRTLLVRRYGGYSGEWSGNNATNAYATSDIDKFLSGEYIEKLDTFIQNDIGNTVFYYTPGNGDTAVTTLSRPAFALSITELGLSTEYTNVEGQAIPIADTLRIAYFRPGSSAPDAQLTKATPHKNMQNLGRCDIIKPWINR